MCFTGNVFASNGSEERLLKGRTTILKATVKSLVELLRPNTTYELDIHRQQFYNMCQMLAPHWDNPLG